MGLRKQHGSSYLLGKKWLIYLRTHFRDLENLANVITKKELEFSEPGGTKQKSNVFFVNLLGKLFTVIHYGHLNPLSPSAVFLASFSFPLLHAC